MIDWTKKVYWNGEHEVRLNVDSGKYDKTTRIRRVDGEMISIEYTNQNDEIKYNSYYTLYIDLSADNFGWPANYSIPLSNLVVPGEEGTQDEAYVVIEALRANITKLRSLGWEVDCEVSHFTSELL